jgi:hypothetical protein
VNVKQRVLGKGRIFSGLNFTKLSLGVVMPENPIIIRSADFPARAVN